MAVNSSIDSESIVKRSTDVQFSQLDEELLAIDSQAGFCYSLNESAGRVWELIATPVQVGAMCDRLQQEFAVDEATCRKDVLALLQDLANAGLLQVSGRPTDPHNKS